MSATAAVVRAPARTAKDEPRGRAEVSIARHVFRQLWVGAVVCAVVFGATVAASALSYVSSFPTELSRQQIAATTSVDTGLAILLGPISSIDTVGGYTVYKCFVFLSTIGAVWALLAATRVLRGEEDAGRWQLLLTGATRPARAVMATIVALLGGVAVIFVGTTLCTMLAGRDPDVGFGVAESALYGLSVALPIAVFGAVGALTSQLGRTRRVATGLAIAVFGIAFVVRMVADSGASTRWLLWFTPFGWAELMKPFTENDVWPLLPAIIAVLVLAGAAAWLASRRDVGDGILASNDVAQPKTWGLRSTTGLAVRLEIPVLAAWCVGAAAAGLVLGLISKVTAASLPESFSNTLDKFGVNGAFTDQYFGVAFLLVATVVALLPASQIGAAGEEEGSGRLVHLLAARSKRSTWFVGRLLLTAVAVVAAGALSGLAAWVGAATQGVHLGVTTMVGAGLNVVPTALVALGIGALALAVLRRYAAGAVYAIVAWSLVVDLVASMITSLSWLGHLSLFHYMALVPAQTADWTTIATTTAVGVALCGLAVAWFQRRDISSSRG